MKPLTIKEIILCTPAGYPDNNIYEIHMTNGETLDMDLKDTSVPGQMAIRTALYTHEEDFEKTGRTLAMEGNLLKAMNYMVFLIPHGALEIIKEEMLEYIYWITRDQHQILINQYYKP